PWMTEKLPMPSFHHPLLEQASFTREVLWTLLKDVKFGETVSYKQLADMAGNSKAARAVGGAMRSNPIPIIIPCHRVICSSGQTGKYTGGSHLKEWLLSHENSGIAVIQPKYATAPLRKHLAHRGDSRESAAFACIRRAKLNA
uniref:Methylated-DNA--protein-cysteine methyltransferase n=1 Tax=Varanus komodoensis TaxID=61221 RepID=A0A8D2KZD4_VARKO